MFDLSNISGLITAVVVLGVLIFVHELGHFLVAKRLKFCVLKFSIGFGKKLFGFVRGETEYLISAIPLGGYVKFYGENAMGEEEDVEALSDEEKERAKDVGTDREFPNIHPFKRILTVLAGPFFNIVFASILFTTILLSGFVVPNTRIGGVVDGRVAKSAFSSEELVSKLIDSKVINEAEDDKNYIFFSGSIETENQLKDLLDKTDINEKDKIVTIWKQFTEKYPAYLAGVKKGDIILEIDGKKVNDWEDVHNFITTGEEQQVRMKVDRDGKELDFVIDPKIEEGEQLGETVKRRFVGIVNSSEPSDMIEKSFGFGEAVVLGAEQTYDYVVMTIMGIKMLIMREIPVRENLGGPIMIIQMTGEFAQKGIQYLLHFMAVISISLGVINLMPIPILDGGAIIFLLIELIKGSPINIKKRMAAQQIGMVLLIALMVFAFYNDIARLVGSGGSKDKKTEVVDTKP